MSVPNVFWREVLYRYELKQAGVGSEEIEAKTAERLTRLSPSDRATLKRYCTKFMIEIGWA